MNKITLLSITTCLFATAATADTARNCMNTWGSQPNQAMNYADFMSLCVDTNYRVDADYRVWGAHAIPTGARAKCNDGSWTTDPVPQDACLNQGGVAVWLRRMWP